MVEGKDDARAEGESLRPLLYNNHTAKCLSGSERKMCACLCGLYLEVCIKFSHMIHFEASGGVRVRSKSN